MRKKKNQAPSEATVASYWEKHDATEVLDLSAKKRVTLVHEPAVQSISLRLPVPLLTKIKQKAANMDIAYQALIKVWLAERAKEEGQQETS